MQNILRKAIYFVSMVHLPFLFKLYKRFCKGGSRYIDEFSLSLFEWRCCCIKVTAIGLVLFVQSLRPTFYLVGLRASLRQLSVVKSIINTNCSSKNCSRQINLLVYKVCSGRSNNTFKLVLQVAWLLCWCQHFKKSVDFRCY